MPGSGCVAPVFTPGRQALPEVCFSEVLISGRILSFISGHGPELKSL